MLTLSVGTTIGLGVATPVTAGAAVATTTHLLPSNGEVGVTNLCGPNAGYTCTPGYTGTNVPTSMWNAYGCPNASGCPTTPHNCYLYVAYRLEQTGIVPTWTDDASGWATQAAATGVPVDQTATVGSVAQWNVGKGHLAWVESVDGSGITVRFDWWSAPEITPAFPGGYTARVRIAPDSPAWPDNFIHYEQVRTSATIAATPIVGSTPLTVQFTGSSSGSPTSWAWKFGDGSTSTQKNPQHTYTEAGTFTVELTAANAYGSTTTTTTITARVPGTPGGYVLDGYGGLHPFRVGTGTSPAAAKGLAYWPGWNIARGVAVLGDGSGGYTLDGFGGLHKFRIGSGTTPPTPTGVAYWKGWDIARGVALMPDGTGGYMVDGYGGIHRFALGGNAKPPRPVGGEYWPGQDVARGITISRDGRGGFVVDRNGRLHAFKIGSGGSAPEAKDTVRVPRLIQGGALVADGTGGFTVDGYGGMHTFRVGDGAAPPRTHGGPYWPGWNIVRDMALIWD